MKKAYGEMFLRYGLLAIVGLLFSVIIPAYAQEYEPGPVPDIAPVIDENGVDLRTRAFNITVPLAKIGAQGAGGLSIVSSVINDSPYSESLGGGIYQTGGNGFTVRLPGIEEEFVQSGGTLSPWRPSPSTLVRSGTAPFYNYTYTGKDGTVATFNYFYNSLQYGIRAVVTGITKPDGETWTYAGSYGQAGNIQTNLGYQYRQSDGNSLINLGYIYCSLTASGCAGFSLPDWPYGVSFINADEKLTSLVNEYDSQSALLRTTVTSPAGVSSVVNYGGNNDVVSVVRGGGTWTYTLDQFTSNLTVTSPSGQKFKPVFDPCDYLGSAEIVPAGQTSGLITTYTYYPTCLLDTVTYPEGNKTKYTYDSTGRVTEVRNIAKPASGVPDMVRSYAYAACTGTTIKHCMKPTSVTDERGQVTTYWYSNAHGGVTKVRSPRESSTGRWAVTEYSYEQKYAWFRTSSSAIQVQSTTPVWRLVQARTCSVTSVNGGCPTSTGADVLVVDYAYEAGNSTTPSNLNLASVTTRSGNGAVSSTVTYSYDSWGRTTYVDGPLPGNGDRLRYEYDRMWRVVRVTEPDPDGSGAAQHRYTEYVYNPDGQVTETVVGKVNAYDGSRTFTSLVKSQNNYDSYGRLFRSYLNPFPNGVMSAPTEFVQFSYDADQRLDCTAIRMNPPWFLSQPSACSQTTGNSDRISQNTYDGYGRLYKVTSGIGTPSTISTERSFTNNGNVSTLQDGRGRQTTYEYDGLDRLSKVLYPNESGSGSSAADFEQYTYKVENSLSTPLVDVYRLRDGQNVSYTYDRVSRVTLVNAPGTVADLTTTFDNLGRPATLVSNGQTLTNSWDALGRLLSQQGPNGTVSYLYDAAGQRTRTTWPDSFYVTYDYNARGAVTAIRENGSFQLAQYQYDDYGRQTLVSFGNGTSTSYGYNPSSLMSSLNLSAPAASAYNQSTNFSYNPAGQISSTAVSNSSYFPAIPNSSLAFTYNGQNEMVAGAGASITHDTRGNLTGEGTITYGYDVANRLTSRSGGTTLSYDPANRLYQVVGASGTVRFQYDGVQLMAEYNTSGAVLRRHVSGPGIDRPIVTYEGAGTTAASRRYMAADERGSVVLITDNSGGLIQRNKFDAYGVPDTGNSGRFQYTGQVWIGDAGVYYYKARVYRPQLGRFLQTDPIGYAGGMNVYAYAGNDPANYVDPLGLEFCTADGCVDEKRTLGVVTITAPAPSSPPSNRPVDPMSLWLWEFEAGLSKQDGDFFDELTWLGMYPAYHEYYGSYHTVCTAQENWSWLSGPSINGPGAPAFPTQGRGSFTREIGLFGGNPISQTIDYDAMSLRNDVMDGHMLGGTLNIRITPEAANTSTIHIFGSGFGPDMQIGGISGFNGALGWAGFLSPAAERVSQCNVNNGFLGITTALGSPFGGH